MKKIILSIRRNRTFKAIKSKLESDRISEYKSKANFLDEMKDLSKSELKAFHSFNTEYIFNDDCIRSSFNLKHWRKVKEARLSTK